MAYSLACSRAPGFTENEDCEMVLAAEDGTRFIHVQCRDSEFRSVRGEPLERFLNQTTISE
jgi:hypothetical protein